MVDKNIQNITINGSTFPIVDTIARNSATSAQTSADKANKNVEDLQKSTDEKIKNLQTTVNGYKVLSISYDDVTETVTFNK